MKTHCRQGGIACLALTLVVFCPRKSLAGAAPTITTPPHSQSALVGSNAAFSVVASGQTPLFYQWSVNGTNLTDSPHISGSTKATLTISNVMTSDAGNYQVVVNNSHGSATSPNAALTVHVPPYIVLQPSNQVVTVSSNASLTVLGGGTSPLSYRWFFDGTPLTDRGRVSGSMTTSLNIANVQVSDYGLYQVVVTNNYGTATSATVALGTTFGTPGLVRFVNVNSTNPTAPYTDWSIAATNIQAAINASSSSVSDTVLVSPGIYNESINFNGKPVWLVSAVGPSNTIINPPAGSSSITFSSGETSNSVVSGFTITNGGIYLSYSSATIVSNVLLNCGTGINCRFSSPYILNNLISGGKGDGSLGSGDGIFLGEPPWRSSGGT